jgi:transcriptional regulator with XRE-family HTH domain
MSQKNRHARSVFICDLITSSRIPRNQLAAAAGLTNTYIRDLELGNIVNVDRGKLLRLAVALNMNLNHIDEMLQVFDRAGLSPADIDLFIESARKRKVTTALFPLRDFYAYELAVYAMEAVPGDQVLVNDRPTVCLRDPGHRTFSDNRLVEAHPLYAELLETIGDVRRRRFEANLKTGTISHYLCRECIEEYVLANKDEQEALWRKKHVANLLDFHRRYDSLKVHITGVCSYMLFSIKHPADGSGTQFNFCAKPGHYVPGERPGRLAGFSTSNPVMLKTFEDELDSLKGRVLPEYETRQGVERFLEELIAS